MKRLNGALVCVSATLLFASPASARAPITTQATLLDRVQIEDMMTEYYALLTRHERHDIGEYFAEEAVLDANGAIFEGRAAIQKLYDNSTDIRVGDGSIYNMLIGNPRITVDGDKAVMDAVWTGFLSDNIYTAPRLVEQGTEHTTFERRDGVWLITSRKLVNQGGTPLWLTGEN